MSPMCDFRAMSLRAEIQSKIELIVRRLLELIAAWRATFEHFELALHHAVARCCRMTVPRRQPSAADVSIRGRTKKRARHV